MKYDDNNHDYECLTTVDENASDYPYQDENLSTYSGKNNTVLQYQAALQQTSNLVQNLGSIYSMHQRTKQIKELTKVQLANTAVKYQLCHEFLTSTFGERHDALEKHYNVLERAIQNGDRDMILASLHGISDIVTTSPLSELQHLAKIFEDTSVPLLDF